MIVDILKNAAQYTDLGTSFSAAFEFLKKSDLAGLAPGKYEIDGSNVYAMVSQYDTRPREEGKWEAHRKYFDIQYIVSGSELIGYSNLEALTVTTPYNEKDDYMLLDGHGDFLTASAGKFFIFSPQDAHMPCMAIGGRSGPVKKVVVKIRV